MDQTREKLHCVICGWDWFKRLGQPDPRRCPNPECRSMRWMGDAGTEAGADEHHDVVPEGDSASEGDDPTARYHTTNIPISLDECAEMARPVRPDPELASPTVLEAMRPVAERVVQKIADELRAEEEIAVEKRRYVPLED